MYVLVIAVTRLTYDITVILVSFNVTQSIKMIMPPHIGHSSNPNRASLGSPIVDEFTNHPSPATKSTPTKRSL
jgi:hypothetical protein